MDTSPLAQFAAIQSGRLPLSLRVEADAPPTRLRYVSLDRFDGEYWTNAAQYRRAGHRLPAAEPGGPTWTVNERITIERAGPLGWLVSSGRPTEVSVAGMGIDESSGEVVIPDDRPVPVEYTVRSEVLIQDPDLVDFAAPASAPRDRIAPVPPDLGRKAAELVGGEFGHPALTLLAEHFAADGGYGVNEPKDAWSGHGILHIRQLLARKQGTAEQYASAFAVMARSLGYDARVVVGFVPREDGSVYRVSGRDIDAWAEVRFQDLGWLPYFPTPGQRAASQEPPKPEPEPTPTAAPAPLLPEQTQGATAPGPLPAGRAALRWLFYIGLLVALIGAAVLTVPLLKLYRRRRRRRGEPRRQVLGAWRDTVDRFVEAGLPAPASATPRELANAATRRFGSGIGHDSGELARLHDAVAYGVTPHHFTSAANAWRHADHVRRVLRRSLRYRDRIGAMFSPRPLTRRR